MLKKLGIAVVALLAMLVLASPPPAKAAVHFGVFVGPPAPVYSYPAPAYPAYPGYYNAPAYPYSYPYVAPGYAYPGYAYPAYGYGGYGYDYGRVWRDHDRHYEYRGHDFRGHESHRR